jgi:hypothetical protein
MADLTLKTVHVQMADVSSAEVVRVPITPGLAGQLMQVRTVLGGAITVADAKLTIKKNSTAIGTITVAYSGSAAGVQDYLDFGASQIFVSEGDRIVIDGDGGSTDAANLGICVEIKR